MDFTLKQKTNIFRLFLALLAIVISSQDLKAQSNTIVNSAEDSSYIAPVALHADGRLITLIEYKKKLGNTDNFNYTPSAHGSLSSIRTMRGFRVLIYSGTDRSKANKIKADYMRRHQGNRVYMTYSQPQYKIKVGDFAHREDASDLYRALCKEYMPCMIVPDIVELKTYRRND